MTIDLNSFERLDPFVHEHERLHQSLGDLRWLLKERRSPETVAATFAEFADHVQAHFVHEEAEEGFFESVIDQAPRLKARADALIEEHVAMFDQLACLRQLAAQEPGAVAWWTRLGQDFEEFWRRFCRHERAENDLMQEAFHDDIGAED